MATAEDLSAEIAAFDEACSCNEEEIQARQQLLNDIGRIVDGIWGDKAAAKAFGSFATHTSAHNSDLDVVITGLLAPANDGELLPSEAVKANRHLTDLRMALSGTLQNMQHISRARIPVLKGTSVRGRIKVDISVGTDSGVRTGETMNQLFNTHRHARLLLRILKAILKYNNLHEVFTGGLSSFSLSNMVVAHLLREQHMAATKGEVPPDNPGALMLLFLKLFGRTFDYARSAVSVRQGGIVSKTTIAAAGVMRQLYYDGEMRIVVEDPVTGRDMAGGTFRMAEVKALFSNALSALEHTMKTPPDATKSYPLLSSVFVVQTMLGRGVDYSAVPPPSHARYKRRYFDRRDFGYRDDYDLSDSFGSKDSRGDTSYDDEDEDYTTEEEEVSRAPAVQRAMLNAWITACTMCRRCAGVNNVPSVAATRPATGVSWAAATRAATSIPVITVPSTPESPFHSADSQPRKKPRVEG